MHANTTTAPALGRDAKALHLEGLEAARSGDLQGAVGLLTAAIDADPTQPMFHSNLGAVLLQLNRPEQALASCDQALALNPNTILALYNRGNVLGELWRLEEAVASYRRALELKPDYLSALKNCATALLQLKRCEEASVYLEKLVRLAPQHDYALGLLLDAKLRCCDWTLYDELRNTVRGWVAEGKRVAGSFAFLAVSDSCAEQLRCASIMTAERYAATADPPVSRTANAGDTPVTGSLDQLGPQTAMASCGGSDGRPIRVAYVSADFREHALSYLMAGVLEHHDRRRFELVGMSLRADDLSAMGERVRRAFDQFHDVSRVGDRQATALMRELEVDIAVDLSGHTDGCRPKIFALRAAPIQVSYLGYPGTLGAPYIDYLLADEFVAPPSARAHYAEQLAYLPECFQANDDRRPIDYSLTRAECGLPESALVLCCFNNSYKLSPLLFDVWLRVLRQRPDSVLWLLADRPIVQRNLCAYAAARGISPQRLIFAPRLLYPQHLGRMALADLFFDTLPFNAGTTASDALWAGVPVLTCAGEAFAARMAGSLLKALGLPELITHSVVEYEVRALELVAHPERLGALRERLTHARTHAPLFNTARFTRHLEQAYAQMYDLHRRGLPPQSFHVPRQ